MLDAKFIEQWNIEIYRLKNKYRSINIETLENIAKTEYGVGFVIDTPLIWDCGRVIEDKGRLHIFYHAPFKAYAPLVLAHEIGHIAAGHSTLQRKTSENEADYFAAKLNNISLETLDLYRVIDAAFIFQNRLRLPFIAKKEIQRLTELGAYSIIQKHLNW